jgi:CopZ-like zinc binding protein
MYLEKQPNSVCPKNRNVCKPVSRITVETLLRPQHRHSLVSLPYFFCDSPDCDVVYVSEKEMITTNQLSVRVGIKEAEDPIPLCYCFNFDRKAIWDDIRFKGTTDIPKIIAQRIKAGECRCEVTNPSGSCCLGDIHRAVKQAEKSGKGHGK